MAVKIARTLFIPLLISVSSSLAAQMPQTFEGEFWVELEPAVRFEDMNTATHDDQLRALLEEARFVFSAMLYGLEFRYVPLDIRREVEEEFEMKLLAEIPWGDPRLTVVDSRYQNGRRYVHIRYIPSEQQSVWIRFWESNVYPVASAYGEGNVFHGQEQKLESIRLALKEAVRAYVRSVEYNKPREILGLAAFTEAPYVIVDSGVYRAKVDAKLDIRVVQPYKVY